MNIWITNLLIPLTLTIATALIGYVIWILQEQRKENQEIKKMTSDRLQAINDGLILLMGNEIIKAHNKYVVDGQPIRPLAYDKLMKIIDTYTKLGGNGTAEKLKNDFGHLKLEKGGIE